MTFWDQGDSKGYIKTKKFKLIKLIKFTVRGGFFTFWAILAHSVPLQSAYYIPKVSATKIYRVGTFHA